MLYSSHKMNPTLIGLWAVLVWGISLPITRFYEERIGVLALMGAVFASIGGLGLARQWFGQTPFPDRQVFLNPFLYGRWIFFVLHEALISWAIILVKREHVPFVILMNYCWPTAVIFCSVWFAGVRISRWWAFLLGSVIVMTSLGIEFMRFGSLSLDLFQSPTDRWAYGMAFIGAWAWGMYCALSRRAGDAAGAGAVIPLFQLTLGLTLLGAVVPGYATWGNLTGWGFLLLGGYCLLQFGAYHGWDLGVRQGNVVALSLCADLIPWISLFASYMILGINIESKTILAALFLVGGAVVTRYGTLQPLQPQLEELSGV